VPEGASQTSDAADLTTSIAAIGSGKLLSRQSYQIQTGPDLAGFGHTQPGCSACAHLTSERSFGLGVVLLGKWITGNKFYAGSGADVGYLPSRKIAIAVITTYLPDAPTTDDGFNDAGPAILASLTQALAPESPIPAG
jgi:CubicO group peptidase (beta-lactamase class C family)